MGVSSYYEEGHSNRGHCHYLRLLHGGCGGSGSGGEGGDWDTEQKEMENDIKEKIKTTQSKSFKTKFNN